MRENGKAIRVDPELWAALRDRSREGDCPRDVIARVLAGKRQRCRKPALLKKPKPVVKLDATTWAALAKAAKPFETPGRVLKRLLGIPGKPDGRADKRVSMSDEIWEAVVDAQLVTGTMDNEHPRDTIRRQLGLPSEEEQNDWRPGNRWPRMKLDKRIWKVLTKAAGPFESPGDVLCRLLGRPKCPRTGDQLADAVTP